MSTTKKLFVATRIIEMVQGSANKYPTITFSIGVPEYFGDDAKSDAQALFDKLMAQESGGDIKITGLSLTYDEHD